MRLLSLEATNWAAYPRIEIDFTDSEYVITGKNNHGKSAILDAITWSLFGRVGRKVDQRSADKFVRDGTDLARVAVTFLTPAGERVRVERERPVGKTGTLNLHVDDERRTRHAIGETQEAIERLIGLDYDALTAGPFMVQKQSDSFMAADPRARKDLLIGLLGLDRFEAVHAEANRRRVEAERDEAAADRELEPLQARVEDGPRAREALASASAGVAEAEGYLTDAQEAVTRLRERAASLDAGAEAYRLAKRRVDEATWRLSRAREARTLAANRLSHARDAVDQAPPAEPAPLPDLAPLEAEQNEVVAAKERTAEIATKRERWAARVAEAERQLAILPTVPCGGAGEYATCRFLTGMADPAEVAKAKDSVARWDEEVIRLAPVVARGPEIMRQIEAASRIRREWERYDAALPAWEATRIARSESVALHEANVERVDAEIAAAETAFAEAEAAMPEAPPDSAALRAALVDAQADVARAEREVAIARQTVVTASSAVVLADDAEARSVALREAATVARDRAAILRLLEAAWHRDGLPTA